MKAGVQMKSLLMVDVLPSMAEYKSKFMVMYKEETLIQFMHDAAPPAVKIPKM